MEDGQNYNKIYNFERMKEIFS